MTLNCVAELRYAKETAEFFDGMGVGEQREWADDLRRRAQLPPPDDAAPRVCLLDSGVTRAHPLLAPPDGCRRPAYGRTGMGRG